MLLSIQIKIYGIKKGKNKMLMGMVKGKKVDQSQRYVNCYIRVGLFDI